jgi:hypothetical protein
MIGFVGRLIGIASAALGVFLLWASPFSTVRCSRDGAGVACRVDRAMLGIVPLDAVKIAGIQHVTVDRNSPPRDPSRTPIEAERMNDTYQLTFATSGGRVSPRGVDGGDGESLRGIAQAVNDLVGGQGDAFSDRSFNAFPNVAGAIFVVVGIPLALLAQ